MKESAIGIFDSGIGGLTVLKELAELLPDEATVYLGDTARVPYGSKSEETVVRYSLEVAGFLATHGIKLLVVACNTASAYAIERLKTELDIPVVGVIGPGARAAVAATRTGRIAVVGTEGTIKSGAYCRAIKALNPVAETFVKACPLFVPIAEEGWSDTDVAELVAEKYLGELKDKGIDTLVLGCTHYPLLKATISKVMGPGITLIDSAEATATEVKEILTAKDLLTDLSTGAPVRRYFATDSPERFTRVGRMFFGHTLEGAELADFEG